MYIYIHTYIYTYIYIYRVCKVGRPLWVERALAGCGGGLWGRLIVAGEGLCDEFVQFIIGHKYDTRQRNLRYHEEHLCVCVCVCVCVCGHIAARFVRA